jgi:hypothetical protein
MIRHENPRASLIQALQGLTGALNAHVTSFSSFIVPSTRDATATFEGYVRELFQSERANILRMSAVNEVDY